MNEDIHAVLKTVAIHEAGHLIIARVLGYRARSTLIENPRPGERPVHGCTAVWPPPPPPEVALAGSLAEAILLDGVTDLTRLRSIIRFYTVESPDASTDEDLVLFRTITGFVGTPEALCGKICGEYLPKMLTLIQEHAEAIREEAGELIEEYLAVG